MKNTIVKKALSIVLTLIMVIGTLSVGGVFAFAKTADIGLNEEVVADITEEGQTESFFFTPATSGYYNLVLLSGDDKAVSGAVYRDSELLAEEKYMLGQDVYESYFESYYDHTYIVGCFMEEGSTYEIKVKYSYDSYTGSIKFKLEQSPLKGIAYNPVGESTVKAGESFYPDLQGDVVTLYFNDGSQKVYKVLAQDVDQVGLISEDGNSYKNEYGKVAVKKSIGDNEVWTLGDTDASVTFSVGPFSHEIPVTVVKDSPKDIVSISVNSPTRVELIENVSGRYDSYDNTFEYNYADAIPVGTQVTLLYNDGSKRVFTKQVEGWYDKNGISGTFGMPQFLISSDPDNTWKKGSENYIIFYATGYNYVAGDRSVQAKLPVYIIDNPIKNVTLTQNRPLIEKPDSDYFLGADLDVTLHLKNGTSKTYTYSYIENMMGAWGDWIDSSRNPMPYGLSGWNWGWHADTDNWSIGKNNKATVTIGTSKYETNVEIIANPVKSIEFTLANNEIVNDNFARFQEGNKLVVNYKDSTSETFTMKFIKEQGFYFVDSNGKIINTDLEVITHNDEAKPYVEVKYLGASSKAYYNNVEKEVQAISYIPIAPIVINETDGYRNKDGSYYYESDLYYWHKLFDDGGVLLVTYTDGSTKKYNAHMNKIRNHYWLIDEQGGDLDYSNFSYDTTKEQLFYPWTVGGDNTITITYRGVTTTVPVYIESAYNEYKGFPDVKDGEWFCNAVKYNATRSFITGYQNGKFGPNDSLKRQDFVCILARIDGADLKAYENVQSKLTDVKKGDYYAAAVNWAVDKGYISGYQNGKFGVNDSITREQVATILYNYMNKPEVKDANKILAKFPDANKVSSFAKIPVAWAVSNGVISGMGNGTVASTSGATRAQIAAIIQRMDTQGMFNK